MHKMKCAPKVRQKSLAFGGAFYMEKYGYTEKLEVVMGVMEKKLSY